MIILNWVKQGDPNQNFQSQFSNVFNNKNISQNVFQRGGFLQFSAVCLQFLQKSAAPETHFGLYHLGYRMQHQLYPFEITTFDLTQK